MSDGWNPHPRRMRIAKRIAGGIGAAVFGGISALSMWGYATASYFSEKVITNTTTTTIINGHSETHSTVQVLDYTPFAPYVLLAAAIVFGFFCLGCACIAIWPDQA